VGLGLPLLPARRAVDRRARLARAAGRLLSGVRIRRATPRDAGAITAIYAPTVRATAISFEIDPPGEDELARRIETLGAAAPWLVCERRGDLLGYAYAGSHRVRPAYRWSVDVSVYVHPDHQRRGVAAALYAALLDTLETQGFHRAYAGITLPNAASVALHEGAGFRAVGVYREVGFKCGAWHDVGWWERELRSGDDPPAEPATLAPERLEPAWERAARSVR
jgi:phosphinothricin acetyltransferase